MRSDLADFLLARIEEDERFAKRSCWPAACDGHNAPISRERLLAECEAKRQLVELGSYWLNAMDFEGEEILIPLARAYADHADFQEEWRPDA